MSIEEQYRVTLEAIRHLWIVEMIAGRSYPALNMACARTAARLTLGRR